VTVTPVSQLGSRNQAAGGVMILQCENGGAQSLVAAFGGFVHDGERTASYERDGVMTAVTGVFIATSLFWTEERLVSDHAGGRVLA
jgi:hypothetical protein